MFSTQYVKNAIKTVEVLLKDEGRQLIKFKLDGKQPFMNGYCPEMEQSDDLRTDLASCYLQLIGILQYTVEVGCIDIFTEVLVMSQYLALP